VLLKIVIVWIVQSGVQIDCVSGENENNGEMEHVQASFNKISIVSRLHTSVEVKPSKPGANVDHSQLFSRKSDLRTLIDQLTGRLSRRRRPRLGIGSNISDPGPTMMRKFMSSDVILT